MSLSVPEAAARLDRSPEQVRKMAAARVLRARRIGRTWVIDERSVAQAAQQQRPSGRPLSPKRAWAALSLLAGIRPMWLPAAGRYQVRQVLVSDRMKNRARWSALLARAVTRHDLVCHPSVLTRLRRDRRVLEIGPKAASRHGLDLLAEGKVPQLLVSADDLPAVCEEYVLERTDESPTVIVSAPGWHEAMDFVRGNRSVLRLVVALSLLKSEDPRARKAGQDAFVEARAALVAGG